MMAAPNRSTRRHDKRTAIAIKRTQGFVTKRLRSMGATDLEVRIARVVVTCVWHGRPQPVSGVHIQERCADRGVFSDYAWWSPEPKAPSYGKIADTLALMEAAELIRWPKAHVPLHHGKLAPADRPRLYPRRPKSPTKWNPDCDPRLPARKLELVGRARRLAVEGVPPEADARGAAPSDGLIARSPGSPSVPKTVQTAIVSIGTARDAETGPPGDSVTRGTVRDALRSAGLGWLSDPF